MKKLIGIAAVALAVLTISTPAQAVSLTFTTSCTANTDPGLVVFCHVLDPGPTIVNLPSPGSSVTLPFAEIGTGESVLDADDFNPTAVSALFDFGVPGSVMLTGSAGWFVTGFTLWIPAIAGVSTQIAITIDPAFFGLTDARLVNFTITCLIGCDLTPTPGQFSAPVPEPGSMVLLGTGLLGLAAAARRRRKNAA